MESGCAVHPNRVADRREFVLKAPLGRAIWSLSWPLAVSNQLSTLTLGVCLFWFGRLLGETGLAVESLFRPLGLLVAWTLGATSVGASVLVSRSVGAADGRGLSLAAGAVTLTVALSGIVIAVAGPLSPWLAGVLVGDLPVERPMLHYILGWLLISMPTYAVGVDLGEITDQLVSATWGSVGLAEPTRAVEPACIAFVQCIFKGLHRSPRIVTDPVEIGGDPDVLRATDVSCLVMPDRCLGLPVMAALERGTRVIAVRDRLNVMKNDLTRLPWRPGQLHFAGGYLEAAGLLSAFKAGLAPETLRRPLHKAPLTRVK